MTFPKRIAIVGAGIAGLSAGIYARMNGFDVTIFEMGHKAGGVCASWERDGYAVNGSIHWLVGSAPGTDLYDMWRQLGVIEGNAFYNHSRFIEYRDVDGVDVHFYVNPAKLRLHLLTISPDDGEAIDEFIHAIETIAENHIPLDTAFELLNPWDWTKILARNFSSLMAMGKYSRISVNAFADKFKSSVLRQVFQRFWSGEMAMTFFLMQLAYASKGTAGYPLGGSGKFIAKLEERYRALGGKLLFGQRVVRIPTAEERVLGVETEDGRQHAADYVIAACDGHTALFHMLPEGYVDDRLRQAYQSLRPFPALAYFSAGVARTFDEVAPSIVGLNVPLVEPVMVGARRHDRATFQIYNFDPTLAPAGKTLITAMLETDFESWHELYDQDPAAYREARERICRSLARNLDACFPGVGKALDFTDLATPLTYHNWTGNYRGSYEGWLPTPEAMQTRLPSHLQRLKNFYMAGHWVTPGGGMPPAAYSGRDAIQLICRAERRHFDTEVP